MGDLNVVPELHDVYDGLTNKSRQQWPGVKQWERKAFKEFLADTKLVDAYRHFHPHSEEIAGRRVGGHFLLLS